MKDDLLYYVYIYLNEMTYLMYNMHHYVVITILL